MTFDVSVVGIKPRLTKSNRQNIPFLILPSGMRRHHIRKGRTMWNSSWVHEISFLDPNLSPYLFVSVPWDSGFVSQKYLFGQIFGTFLPSALRTPTWWSTHLHPCLLKRSNLPPYKLLGQEIIGGFLLLRQQICLENWFMALSTLSCLSNFLLSTTPSLSSTCWHLLPTNPSVFPSVFIYFPLTSMRLRTLNFAYVEFAKVVKFKLKVLIKKTRLRNL